MLSDFFTACKKIYDDLLKTDNPSCVVCGKEIFDGAYVCSECKKSLPYNDGCICDVCGRIQAAEGVCMECKASLPKPNMSRSVFVFDGEARNLVYRFKNGYRYLENFLCDELFRIGEKYFKDKADIITFVPMFELDRLVRGFNQSEELARELSKRLSLPCSQFITKMKKSAEQKKLSKRERRENLTSCFKVTDRSCKNKRVLLVDDVLTTGATSDAVAELLFKAGAKKVYLITIASVEYKTS